MPTIPGSTLQVLVLRINSPMRISRSRHGRAVDRLLKNEEMEYHQQKAVLADEVGKGQKRDHAAHTFATPVAE